MCIIFLYVNPDHRDNLIPGGAYKLILVMNRDESGLRPTQPCQWQDNILAGRDLSPGGKEGGTWLAMDKTGRVGILTNIFTGTYEKDGAGRGHLIMDFLKTPQHDPMTYLSDLAESPTVYNPFNLILVDLNSSNSNHVISSYTRGKAGHVVESESPMPMPNNAFLGVSNSPTSQPFKKTEAGEMRFRALVKDLEEKNPSDKDQLIEALFQMMRDKTAHYPDPQMDRQGGDPQRNVQLSSIFVDIDQPRYGTRMQSVILIDHRNKATFVERTKPEEDGSSRAWTEIRHDFDLEQR